MVLWKVLYNSIGDAMNMNVLGQDIDQFIQIITEKSVQFEDNTYKLYGDYIFIVFEFDDQNINENHSYIDLKHEFQGYNVILNEIKTQQYLEMMDKLPNYELKNQLHHYLYEKERIIEGVEHLINHQFIEFGKLMYQSYDSYKNFFGHTTQKQDQLMIFSRKYGAIGSNISHNRFISLIYENQKDDFIKNIKNYYDKTYKETLRLIW